MGLSSCLLWQVLISASYYQICKQNNLLPVFQALRLIPRPVIYRPVPAFFSLFFFLDDFPLHFVFPGDRIRRHLPWPAGLCTFLCFQPYFCEFVISCPGAFGDSLKRELPSLCFVRPFFLRTAGQKKQTDRKRNVRKKHFQERRNT